MKPIDEGLLQDAVAYIDRWVEYRRRTLAIPGIAVAIGHRERVLLSRAYGVADAERGVALTADHAFRIASHSKMFTATAVMLLVQRDALRLDDRAARWLPWCPNEPGQIGRVTVRQLLSHSAGVIRDGEDGGFWQLERDYPDWGELRAALREIAPVFPQNQQFKYSNFGFAMLGLIVEAASGVPYNEFVAREIVEPLGLTCTGPELDDLARERLATGYTGDHYGLERVPLAQLDTRALSPATGFYSTAEDLCRFGAAQFLAGALLTDESRREMQRVHWRVEGTPMSYGLGLDVQTIGERRMVGHGGGFPGFITHTRIDPVDQLVLVALTNASDGPAADFTAGMAALVNRALEATPLVGDDAHVELDRCTGRYWSVGSVIDVARFGGQLVGLFPEAPTPTEVVLELTPDGPGAFRLTKAPGFASPGERVSFSFDAAGMVEEVQWAAIRLRPWRQFEAHVLPVLRETGRGPRR